MAKVLSVKEMQKALYRDLREKKWPYFSTNTKAIGQEADFVGVTRSKLVTEYEIKRSRSDFQADFKKKEKHRFLKDGKSPVNYFYYVCPAGMILPNEVPKEYGLIWIEKRILSPQMAKLYKVNYMYIVETKTVAKRLHTNRISDYLLIKLLTSVMYKYFSMLDKPDREIDE